MAELPTDSSEITLRGLLIFGRELFKFLLSKWKILCILCCFGGVIGIVYQWIQKPKYEAVLTFSTEEDKGGGTGSLAGLAAQFGFDIGRASSVFSGDNILPLIQ